MNTINNPLKLKYYPEKELHGDLSKFPFKSGDKSGEYVSKELAVEMLEALEDCLEQLSKIPSTRCVKAINAIKKAKG